MTTAWMSIALKQRMDSCVYQRATWVTIGITQSPLKSTLMVSSLHVTMYYTYTPELELTTSAFA